MAVKAKGSRFTRNNRLVLAAVCLGGALWFGHDGWLGEYRQKELAKNDGQPTANLYFNQYAPIPLAAVTVFCLISGLRVPSRWIVAEDERLAMSNGQAIAYGSVKKIDTRRFAKDGHFTVEYEESGKSKQMKFSDRQYDDLGLLLDELVRRTGAAPADSGQKQTET